MLPLLFGGLLDFGRFITGFRKRRRGTLSSCHVTAECGVQNEKLSRLAEAVEAGKKLAQIYADSRRLRQTERDWVRGWFAAGANLHLPLPPGRGRKTRHSVTTRMDIGRNRCVSRHKGGHNGSHEASHGSGRNSSGKVRKPGVWIRNKRNKGRKHYGEMGIRNRNKGVTNRNNA
jgi:hypothetical protein